MSLINEVLRNLEASRPDDPARQNLQREIRALPDVRKSYGRQLFLGIFAVAGLSTAAYLWYSEQPAKQAPAVAAAPVAVPQAGEAAAGAVVNEAPAPPVALDETLLPADTLRLDLELVNVPAVPALAIAETAPAVADPAPGGRPSTAPVAASALADKAPPAGAANVVSAPPALPAAASAPAKPPAAAVSSAPPAAGRIEKTLAPPGPREAAEQELRRIETLLASGQHDLAEQALRQVLLLDPANLPVRQKLIRVQLAQQKIDAAMATLDAGLALTPRETSWAMSLARLQLDKGDLIAAQQTLERSRPYAGQRADFLGFLGHVKSRLGMHGEGATLYMQAAQLSPGEGRWWLGLGLALVAENRPVEAREAFRRAVASGSLNGELLRLAEQQAQ